jgi:hypothetical protein
VTPNQVAFTTPDPVKLPLPSPDLLALHAACVQVAHLSGAREYIDRFRKDMAEIDERTTARHRKFFTVN